jgi:hypothetical protein
MAASNASLRRWAAGPVCSWPSWCRTSPPNVLNRSMMEKLTRPRGKGYCAVCMSRRTFFSFTTRTAPRSGTIPPPRRSAKVRVNSAP